MPDPDDCADSPYPTPPDDRDRLLNHLFQGPRKAGGLSPPSDPSTPLGDGAAALHELYQSFLDAGFPEDRAAQLTMAFLFHALDRDGPARG